MQVLSFEAVLRREVGELGLDVRFFGETHLLRMPEVADQRLGRGGCGAGLRQTEPEVPVGELVQLGVEAAEIAGKVSARDDGGCSGRKCVPRAQKAADLVGVRSRQRLDHVRVVIEDEHRRVRPDRFSSLGGVELTSQLARRPHVVVIEERDPGTPRLGEPRVPRPCLA